MPRERTTWNRTEIAKAAGLKVADPYTMNQEHYNPPGDEYVIGDPSSFAEDVHPSGGTWEAEYAGGQVKRNEIGMPEMRADTFNHAEKTASEEFLTKKAALCVAIARAVLPKTASNSEIEDQSFSFMHLPDSEVMSTYSRLAGQQEPEEESQEDEDEDEGQVQQKQGGQIPPQFKENVEKKKEEAKEKKEQESGQSQQKKAQDQISQLQQQAQQIQQQIAQLQQQQAQAQQQAQQQMQMAQCQQVQSQAQAVSQAVQQAIAQGQDPVQAVQQVMQSQQQQAPMAQQQQSVSQDSELIDAMLAQDPIQAPTAEMDIQIEAPTMDVGEAQLGPEDDVLNQLFASHQEVRLAQQAQGQEPEDQGQVQQKQAHVVRTASMRTVGTRPTAGVSQIGGLPSASAGGDKLSSLWNSAPDVREAFGLPTNR